MTCDDSADGTSTTTGPTSAVRLRCPVQKYEWGQRGSASAVARLAGETIDETAPYAELWMGTHPSGPALVHATGKPLAELLVEHPEMLGGVQAYPRGGGLPFLFKVLSVGKALSIQAHPDKELAEELHTCRPHVYKDDNHKPEMAIALTSFKGLCGFRSPETVVRFMEENAEFAEIVGAEVKAQLRAVRDDAAARAGLRALLTAVLSCPPEISQAALGRMQERLRRMWARRTPEEEMVLTIAADFPGDVGAVAPFFLHLVHLEPGESFFMAANEPHAYLQGDILECMACSDNVVRAGLTPKLIDIPVLVDMLTYNYGYPEIRRAKEGDRTLYRPPVPDFEVEVFVAAEGAACAVPPSASPQIALLVEGGATVEDAYAPAGSVFFLPAGTDFYATATDEKLKVAVARAQICAGKSPGGGNCIPC